MVRVDPVRVCLLGTLTWDPGRWFVFLLICLMSIWLLDQLENLQGQKEHFSAFSCAKFYYHTEGKLGKTLAFLSQKPVKVISLLAALPPAPWEVSSLGHCHRLKNSTGLSPGFPGESLCPPGISQVIGVSVVHVGTFWTHLSLCQWGDSCGPWKVLGWGLTCQGHRVIGGLGIQPVDINLTSWMGVQGGDMRAGDLCTGVP